MRILLDYRPALRHRTGVGEFAHQMASALASRPGTRDRVVLFSSSWKDRLPSGVVAGADAIDARIPVSVLNFAWHRLAWPPVERLGGQADVAWSMHPLLLPARRAAQVVTIHDLYFLDHPEAAAREIRRDYGALAAAHARRADAVIAVSEYTKAQVVERLGVPPERITVCSPGAPAWEPREEPAPLGPILHVGTVEPRKNVPALLEAYEQLRRERPEVPPLVLAGRVEVPPPRTTQHVRFLGYVTDERRRQLYREASMLVVASADEGFGIPALEAMTMGVPVVAAARGSLPEVVGDAGLLIAAADPEAFRLAFADAMARVLEDVSLRRELAARGIERAARFDWNASATRARAALHAAVTRRQERG